MSTNDSYYSTDCTEIETCNNVTECSDSECAYGTYRSDSSESESYCDTSTTCDSSSSNTCDSSSTCSTTCDSSNTCSTTCDSSYSSNTCASTCSSNTSKTSSCYTDSETGCSSVNSLGTIASSDESCTNCDDICNESQLLSNDAETFVYEHGYIRPNAARGIGYDTPLILGTNQLKHVCGIEHVKFKNQPLLAVNGDVYVSGHIYSGNHSNTSKYIHGGKSEKINVRENKIVALEPIKEQNATYYYVDPKDASNILYVSPINGPVYVVLGSKHGQCDFRANQAITIKDISLVNHEGSSYNIYITVPSGNTSIEHYGSDCKLKISSPGTYVINTSNGSATFRYMKGDHKGCWLIENQLIGNTRILPGTGLKFNQAEKRHVKNLLK